MPTWFAPRIRRWFGEHPVAADVIFASVVGALTMLGMFAEPPQGSQQDPDVSAVLLIVGQAVAFAFRRSAPLRSAGAVVALTVVFWMSDYPSNFEVVTLLSIYAATAHGGVDRRRVWWLVGGLVVLMTTIATIGVLIPEEDLPPAAVFGIAALHITAAITGEIVYDRRLRLVAYEQRALRAEAERELLARHAVLDERARIARDLHDVVAHGMSVMVVQAGAAERVVADDPEAARAALGHIQSTGRDALAQMRQMLGVLRDEHHQAALSPSPGSDDLHRVVQHCVDSGIPTRLTVQGDAPSHSVGQDVATYRIVQEALTNVIKHAGTSATALVEVTYRDDAIDIEVTDTGRGASEATVRSSTGHGLIGMRERVDLYGGSLRAGPRPGGGFRVAATIPLASATAHSTPVEVPG